MIGPSAFRLLKDAYSEDLSRSANRPMTSEIAERMPVPADEFQRDFFGEMEVRRSVPRGHRFGATAQSSGHSQVQVTAARENE
jgi:hypothetical protein